MAKTRSFTRVQLGDAYSRQENYLRRAGAGSLFLRGVVTGALAFAVFFFLLASFIVQLGLPTAFGLALLAAVTLQYFLFCYLRKD
jgi:hypothetical protein